MSKTLLENFYTLASSTPNVDGRFECTIVLNALHPIYKGHFPQIPVTPGVCLTQMIKEIVEDKYALKLRLTEADNIKFLGLINPMENNLFKVEFQVSQKEPNQHLVVATISYEGKTFVKFKGILSE